MVLDYQGMKTGSCTYSTSERSQKPFPVNDGGSPNTATAGRRRQPKDGLSKEWLGPSIGSNGQMVPAGINSRSSQRQQQTTEASSGLARSSGSETSSDHPRCRRVRLGRNGPFLASIPKGDERPSLVIQ